MTLDDSDSHFGMRMTIVCFVLTPFRFVFVQRGLLEIGLLSIGAGLLGPWLVLRGLAFYTHAVGTAAFPRLVLAAGLALSPPLGPTPRSPPFSPPSQPPRP